MHICCSRLYLFGAIGRRDLFACHQRQQIAQVQPGRKPLRDVVHLLYSFRLQVGVGPFCERFDLGFFPGKLFEVFRNIHHDNPFVWDGIVANIFHLQDTADAKRFGHSKSTFARVSVGRLRVKLDQARMKVVDDGHERQTRFPGAAEVCNGTASVVVTTGDALAPQKQTLLPSHAVQCKFVDLKTENDSPHQIENRRYIALVDISGVYQTLQVDSFVFLDEIETCSDIFKRAGFSVGFAFELQCNAMLDRSE